MTQTQKKSIITAALLALLTTTVGCVAHDDRDRRYNRNDRSSRLDLDRDGRVEQWERDRWDRDGDGRVEQWERDRGPSYTSIGSGLASGWSKVTACIAAPESCNSSS